jgi:hypothetical protein
MEGVDDAAGGGGWWIPFIPILRGRARKVKFLRPRLIRGIVGNKDWRCAERAG